MRWSWKMGEVGGVGIYIHATFVLLIAWIGFAYWFETQDLAAASVGVLFILTLFGCVLLHELGHAFAAKKVGISTRDITLYPIGGVAKLERMPDKPLQELGVALAGPAVNVIIAVGIYLWLVTSGAYQPVHELGVATGSFLERVMIANIFLGVFNMLPAFPMDGGRVVRALLATRLEYTQATQIAAAIGQGMALLFGFLGILFNPFLLFIALFVWIGAGHEATATMMKHSLGGIPVRQAMITDFRTLSPHDTLRQAIDLVLTGSQVDFPVLDGEKIVGILTRSDLLRALAEEGQDAPVEHVMLKDFEEVHPHDMLDQALARHHEYQCHTIPVSEFGRLVGLVTMDNIGEFLMIQAALKGVRAPLSAQQIPQSIGR